MEKKELKKQIDTVVGQIKSNSKDVHFADKLIDSLLSLKGQYDVEPTRVYICEKDVVKEYDFDNVRFVCCKGCIIYEAKGGMKMIVYPTMKGLYEHLGVLLDMKDNYDTLNDDGKNVYEGLYSATLWILNACIYSTVDDEVFVGIATDIMSRFDKYVKSKENKLQEETHKENADFENISELLNDNIEKDA